LLVKKKPEVTVLGRTDDAYLVRDAEGKEVSISKVNSHRFTMIGKSRFNKKKEKKEGDAEKEKAKSPKKLVTKQKAASKGEKKSKKDKKDKDKEPEASKEETAEEPNKAEPEEKKKDGDGDEVLPEAEMLSSLDQLASAFIDMNRSEEAVKGESSVNRD